MCKSVHQVVWMRVSMSLLWGNSLRPLHSAALQATTVIRVHQLVKRIGMKVTLKLMIALRMRIIPKLNHLLSGLLHSYSAFKQLMSCRTMLLSGYLPFFTYSLPHYALYVPPLLYWQFVRFSQDHCIWHGDC